MVGILRRDLVACNDIQLFNERASRYTAIITIIGGSNRTTRKGDLDQ